MREKKTDLGRGVKKKKINRKTRGRLQDSRPVDGANKREGENSLDLLIKLRVI